jgi:hypothetical protein
MFQIFKELTERIQEKKEQPDKKKEALTFDEFAELFQKCPIPEVEYTEHFKAFIQTLDVDDEGFKEDLKKCYALCAYRLDKALRPKTAPKPEPAETPDKEAPKEVPTEAPKEAPKEAPEIVPDTVADKKMTGGTIPACITSIRLKTIASRKRDEVMDQILS